MKRKTLITTVVLASTVTAAIPLSIVLSSKINESSTLDEKVHSRWEEIENELATSLAGFDVRSQDDVTRYENISQEAKITSADAYRKLERVVGYNERGGFYVDKDDIQKNQNIFNNALNEWAKSMYGADTERARWIAEVKSFALTAQANIDNKLDGYENLAQYFNIAYDTRKQNDAFLPKHMIHFTDLNEQSSDEEVIYEFSKLLSEGMLKVDKSDIFGLTEYYEKSHFDDPAFQGTTTLPIEVVLYRFFQKVNYANIGYDPKDGNINLTDQLKDLRMYNITLAKLENPNKAPKIPFSARNTVAYDLEGDNGVAQSMHDSGRTIINPFIPYGSTFVAGDNLTGVGVDTYLSELIKHIATYDKQKDAITINDAFKALGLNVDIQKRSTPVQFDNKGQIETHYVFDLNSISFTKDGATTKWAPNGLKMFITINANDEINAVVLENWNSWIDSLDDVKAALQTFKNLVKPELYDIDQLINYIIPPSMNPNAPAGKPNLFTDFSNWWNDNGPTLFGLNKIVDEPAISALLNTDSFTKMLNGATANFTVVTNSILDTFTRIARTINPSSDTAVHVSALAKTYLISKSRVFASREWLNSKDYVLSINVDKFNAILRKYNISQDSVKIYVTNSYWGKTTSETSTNVLAFTPRPYETSVDFDSVFNTEQITDKLLEDYPFNKKEIIGYNIASQGQGHRLHITNDSIIKFELSLDKNLDSRQLTNEQARLPQLFEFNDIGELYDL